MLLNLFGFITAPIMFPIAYLFRKVRFVRNGLLWIYYDDEDEYGFDVEWWMNDHKPSFWMAYKWNAIRNPAWNLQAATRFRSKDLDNAIALKIKGMLQKNGERVPYFNVRDLTAVLKFVDVDGGYSDNRGAMLSLRYSTIGSLFMIFYLNHKRYWRYSYANRLFGKVWMELQIGYHTRPTFRLKFKIIDKIYEWPEEQEIYNSTAFN